MLAVDRDNSSVAQLYQQFNPAVLRTIKSVIDAGHKRNVWVGMCGEMAGDPLATGAPGGAGDRRAQRHRIGSSGNQKDHPVHQV